MQRHHLKANAETCHWGFFDAARKPVLTVDSGDEVTVDTLTGAPEVVPASGFHVPPELAEVHAGAERLAGGPHILTGPIAVRGAKPGQVLEVRILDVKLRQDWGFNVIRPLAGTLQDDFHETRLIHIPLDADAQRRAPALGAGAAAGAVLRHHGRRPAEGMGTHHLDRAARARRQPRQQGAGGRDHAVPARLRRRRAVLLR